MENLHCYHDFINIIKCILTNDYSDFEHSSCNLDWKKIYTEFQNHSITTLAIDSVNNIPMPNDINKLWKNDILVQSSHFIKILHAQKRISQTLNLERINWVVLKGTSAALYYSNPYQRTIGDIDILVSEKDFERAKKTLSNAGFNFSKNIYKYDRHITARKDDITIELHRFFADTREIGNDKVLNDLLLDSLGSCIEKSINDVSFNVLPKLECGIVLIEHIRHHIKTGIGLRQILDFIMYANNVLNDDFWNNSFKEIAERLEFDTLCKVLAKIGQTYFGLCQTITWCNGIDDTTVEEFLELVLCQGDFGIKANESFNPTIRVFNKYHSGLYNFFKYEQASGMKNWKKAQEYKFLRPFAWLYGIGRHIKMTLTNKDDIKHIKENHQQSYRQSKLLKKLKI